MERYSSMSCLFRFLLCQSFVLNLFNSFQTHLPLIAINENDMSLSLLLYTSIKYISIAYPHYPSTAIFGSDSLSWVYVCLCAMLYIAHLPFKYFNWFSSIKFFFVTPIILPFTVDRFVSIRPLNAIFLRLAIHVCRAGQ